MKQRNRSKITKIIVVVVVVNSSERTHVTLVNLESPRELLPFYSSVAFVPLTTYQSLRKPWNITIPLGGWWGSLTN